MAYMNKRKGIFNIIKRIIARVIWPIYVKKFNSGNSSIKEVDYWLEKQGYKKSDG